MEDHFNREERELGWINHSVGCYFCGTLFDEREGHNADEYNDNDGGTICPKCFTKEEATMDDHDYRVSVTACKCFAVIFIIWVVLVIIYIF